MPWRRQAIAKGVLITAHHIGWLEDGTEFDSPHRNSKPFQGVIGAGQVIKGWGQDCMAMHVGGKRKLFVPAHLAYGERQDDRDGIFIGDRHHIFRT